MKQKQNTVLHNQSDFRPVALFAGATTNQKGTGLATNFSILVRESTGFHHQYDVANRGRDELLESV